VLIVESRGNIYLTSEFGVGRSAFGVGRLLLIYDNAVLR
jgi:hypothetical protein